MPTWRARADGGTLAHKGTVEVLCAVERDGRHVYRDLGSGVYVSLEAPNEYVRQCLQEYGLRLDRTGRYAAVYRAYHIVGLELAVSVLRAGLRGEPTGLPAGFQADVVSVAKRDLASGEVLDGEGGYCVYGQLAPAGASLAAGSLPVGLAHNVKLKRSIAAGQQVRWTDVEYDPSDPIIRLRREMERRFAPAANAG